MTAMNHAIKQTSRMYQLRIEYGGNWRPIIQSKNYKELKEEGNKKVKTLKKGESLIMTTLEGYEVIRWT